MIPWSSGYSAEVWDMKLLIHSSQKEVSDRLALCQSTHCLLSHCLCGKGFKLSMKYKIEFVECYFEFASYFI